MSRSNAPQKTSRSLQEKVITSPSELAKCCEQLVACQRFGLDTEFVGEDSYHPKLCLIQVATARGLFLIDPQTVGSLDSFWKVVTNPNHVVIVHAGREEVRLCQLWSGLTPANLFDLQIAAGMVGLTYPLSHGKLVHQVLGIRLSKAETLTEWRNRPLTKEQIQYAYDDVRYLLPLWEKLSTQLDILDRLPWAREEFERLKTGAMLSEEMILPTSEKWRKLRGIGSLDRRGLAVVRELYEWRELAAARANRPARTIVRDDLLVEIARRNPGSSRDLKVIRGVPKQSLEAIFQVVKRVHTAPTEEYPIVVEKEQDPAQLNLIAHLLTAVLGDLCSKKQLATNLVASQQDIRQMVRSHYYQRHYPDDTPLFQGWRATHILPELEAVLRGERVLRIKDLQAADPFQVEDIKPC